MDDNSPKSPKYYGMRASEVLDLNRNKFLTKFEILKQKGIANRLRVFGSVARGEDCPESDIDFLVDVKTADLKTYVILEEALSDWIRFPIHILMNDGCSYIAPFIFGEAKDL